MEKNNNNNVIDQGVVTDGNPTPESDDEISIGQVSIDFSDSGDDEFAGMISPSTTAIDTLEKDTMVA